MQSESSFTANWQGEECTPYRDAVTAPVNADGTKSIPRDAVNDVVFWQCNMNYEFGKHHFYKAEADTLASKLEASDGFSIESYSDAAPYLAAPLFVILTLCVFVWRMAHQRRIHTFLLVQLEKIHESLVRLDRPKSTEVSATVSRELEESRHTFPYILAIRSFSRAPGLPEVMARSTLNIDTIQARLHPRETNEDYAYRLRIETENRGRLLGQDLDAEIPRFKRQMKEISKNHEHQRWLASQAEISRLRQAIIAVNVEIRNNPAIAAQLMEVISVLNSFEQTMVQSREDGTVPDSAFGEMMDAWMTGVLYKNLEKRFNIKAA